MKNTDEHYLPKVNNMEMYKKIGKAKIKWE